MIISDCRADLPPTVLASREEDVTLPCVDANVTDPKSCYRVRWIKYSADAGQKKVVMAWSHKSQQAERVKLKVDGEKQMSLLLTNVQKSDEGLYSCEMCQGWDCELVRNISLRVKDCKLLPAMNAAPSAPIKLDFPVDVTSRPQNISWLLLKGGQPLPLPSDRFQVNHTSLVIQPMRASDSAWYRCDYIYRQAKRCFDIKINVQGEGAVEVTMFPVAQQVLTNTEPPLENGPEESKGTLIAVVTSVVIGIVVAAAVIGVLIYSCRNTQRVPQRTQRSPAAGTLPQCDVYETISLSDDPSNSRFNSIYQVGDETICTFHY
nr:PREDICTED: uncharacterized protein LOC109633199 [Paralichthys olivaceus]